MGSSKKTGRKIEQVPYSQRVEYFAAWHQKHRRRRLADLAVRRKRNKSVHQRLVRRLKSQPCTDCGKKFPHVAMDFDHVRGKKFKNISALGMYPIEVVKREIAKCELVCAVCHRIRSHRRTMRRLRAGKMWWQNRAKLAAHKRSSRGWRESEPRPKWSKPGPKPRHTGAP